jgi:hypothetical protein
MKKGVILGDSLAGAEVYEVPAFENQPWTRLPPALHLT